MSAALLLAAVFGYVLGKVWLVRRFLSAFQNILDKDREWCERVARDVKEKGGVE